MTKDRKLAMRLRRRVVASSQATSIVIDRLIGTAIWRGSNANKAKHAATHCFGVSLHFFEHRVRAIKRDALWLYRAIAIGELFEASSQQNVGIAVHYRFPEFAVGAAWSHVDVYGPTGNVWLDNSSLANGASWHAWKFDNFEVSTQYYFMPNFWLGAVYTFATAHLTADNGTTYPSGTSFRSWSTMT
jgi:predicted porin